MTIGYIDKRKVTWSEYNNTIRVYGTEVLLLGAKTKQEAIDQAKRNLINFKTINR